MKHRAHITPRYKTSLTSLPGTSTSMANPNGRPAGLNGPANGNVRVVTNGAGGGAKVDPNDPQVRKLVYNMYRGMLGQKHQQANVIVDSAPQQQVEIDSGVGARVESMM